MNSRILRNLILASAASLGVAACTDGYGYSGVGYGYSSGYYDGYGGGYGDPYYGWYDGWYYPGTGYYVYDNRGTARRWDDRHRRHWEGRRGYRQGDGRRDRNDRRWNRRENWDGYHRDRRHDDGRPMWRSGRY